MEPERIQKLNNNYQLFHSQHLTIGSTKETRNSLNRVQVLRTLLSHFCYNSIAKPLK